LRDGLFYQYLGVIKIKLYIKNPHGRVVSVTPEIWEKLKHKEGFRLIDTPLADKKENDLMNLFKRDLIKMAKREGIKIRTNVTKKELIEALTEKAGG